MQNILSASDAHKTMQGWSFAEVANMSKRVRLNCSTWSSLCGWYELVLDFHLSSHIVNDTCVLVSNGIATCSCMAYIWTGHVYYCNCTLLHRHTVNMAIHHYRELCTIPWIWAIKNIAFACNSPVFHVTIAGYCLFWHVVHGRPPFVRYSMT